MNFSISRIFPVFLLVALISGACNTTKIKGPKPPDAAFTEPPKPLSVLLVPVSLNLNEIAAMTNKQFQGVLYFDNSFEDNGTDNLKLTVSKRGNFIINGTQNSIQIHVPLHLDAVYRFSTDLLGVKVNKEQSLSVNATVILKTIPTVTPDWNLAVKSTTTLLWDDLPVISFAGINLDMPKLFGKIIQKQADKISTQIDQEIPKQVKLREMVSTSLATLSEPMQIDETTNSWLSLHPGKVFLTPLQGQDSLLKINIGLSSLIEVVSGYKPASVEFKLPPVHQVSKLDEKVKLMISSQITFEQINKLLKQEVVGKKNELSDKDYSIKILDAQAFPNGNRLYIGIKLNGWYKQGILKKKIKGILYVQGIPVYNEAKKQVYIDQFDFDIKTKDILLKSASWLIKSGSLKQKITQSLVFPVGSEIESAQKLANEALNKKYANYVQLSGNVTRIAPTQVIVTPQNLRMDIAAEGNIQVKLSGF